MEAMMVEEEYMNKMILKEKVVKAMEDKAKK